MPARPVLTLAALALCATAQTTTPPAVVAGIPVNYDEAKAQVSSLPDPLRDVSKAKDWRKRRAQLLALHTLNQFGHAPARPKAMTFDVFDKGTPAFNGKALRRQITVYFTADEAGPKMDLLLYLPAAAKARVPVLLNINFMPNSSVAGDEGVKPGEMWGKEKKRVPAPKNSNFGRLIVEPFIEQGIGVASVYYGDIEPDFDGGDKLGIRAAYPDTWGAIAAWAWGLSRAVDYLVTDDGVDAKNIGIFGISRLGKTVLWAGAQDTRIAFVISSCSGEAGAALSRRNYGETVNHMTARFGYQFTPKYKEWAERVNDMPFDAHTLLSLIAPRPLLLQTGDKDFWSDPKGEFLSAQAAAPVWKLLGQPAMEKSDFPAPGTFLNGSPAYFMHAGGHGTIPADWPIFLKFVQSAVQPVGANVGKH